MRDLRPRCVLALSLLVITAATTAAQQPFITDDAGATEKGHFHFQFSNQLDLLHRDALPATRQNTAVVELEYGLLDGLKIGVDALH